MSTASPEPQLVIGHGNVHNEWPGVEKLLRRKPDSLGLNEAHTLHDRLLAVPGYRLVVPGTTRSSGDVPCLTKDSHKDLGSTTLHVSDPVPKAIRVAPDRYLSLSCYRHELAVKLGFKGVAHFVLHPDAGPEALSGTDPKNRIVQEHKEALTTALELMKAYRRIGYLLILTMDGQVSERNDKPWTGQQVLEPLKLDHYCVDIDWIYFDRALTLIDYKDIKLYDHTGFVVKLKERV